MVLMSLRSTNKHPATAPLQRSSSKAQRPRRRLRVNPLIWGLGREETSHPPLSLSKSSGETLAGRGGPFRDGRNCIGIIVAIRVRTVLRTLGYVGPYYDDWCYVSSYYEGWWLFLFFLCKLVLFGINYYREYCYLSSLYESRCYTGGYWENWRYISRCNHDWCYVGWYYVGWCSRKLLGELVLTGSVLGRWMSGQLVLHGFTVRGLGLSGWI